MLILLTINNPLFSDNWFNKKGHIIDGWTRQRSQRRALLTSSRNLGCDFTTGGRGRVSQSHQIICEKQKIYFFYSTFLRRKFVFKVVMVSMSTINKEPHSVENNLKPFSQLSPAAAVAAGGRGCRMGSWLHSHIHPARLFVDRYSFTQQTFTDLKVSLTCQPAMLITCYLCGREFSRVSLGIHLAVCRRRWAADQVLLEITLVLVF